MGALKFVMPTKGRRIIYGGLVGGRIYLGGLFFASPLPGEGLFLPSPLPGGLRMFYRVGEGGDNAQPGSEKNTAPPANASNLTSPPSRLEGRQIIYGGLVGRGRRY